MQAIQMTEYGGPEVLQLRDAPEPQERDGWSIVELSASALNWHDTITRRGLYKSPLPHILGADGAGRLRASGEEVVILPSLHWGNDESAPASEWEILGDYTSGTYAELVSVPNECIFPRPASWSIQEAAASGLVGVTTYRALVSRGRLRAGETLLILGAGGGVATMAIAIGVAIGAKVIVTSSSQGKIDQAKAMGAVAGVDHSSPDWVDEVRRLTPGGAGVDLVLDSVGRIDESLNTLVPGGRCVVLGANVQETAPVSLRPFYFGQYDLLGTTMGSARDFKGFLNLVENSGLSAPVIDSRYPLEEAAEAHRHLESGAGFGKIILEHH